MTVDYKVLKANNEKIGRFMGLEPEIEYSVGSEDAYTYNPKQIGYSWPPEQKRECERWLKEMPQLVEQGYFVRRDERWPYFHQNWNELIKVIERIELVGAIVEIWLSLSRGCKIMIPKNDPVIIASDENINLTDAVYNSVLQFIDWYNTTKQS